jgi:hypothetical protein
MNRSAPGIVFLIGIRYRGGRTDRRRISGASAGLIGSSYTRWRNGDAVDGTRQTIPPDRGIAPVEQPSGARPSVRQASPRTYRQVGCFLPIPPSALRSS